MFDILLGIAFLVMLVLVLNDRRRARANPAVPPRPDGGAAYARSLTPPDPEDMPRIMAQLAPHRRTAYLPAVEDGDGPPTASKFGGAPMLAPGEAWPPCGHCGRPMQLFVQLAADELPAEARERVGPGNVLQLFYCTNDEAGCEFECEAYAPHAKSTLVRILPVDAGAVAPAVPEGMFAPKRIVGWRPVDDYPGWEERDELGLEEFDLDHGGEDGPADARQGDKLLGWPSWVQGIEYPECRICGARMEMLVQLESEENVDYMFGDLGTGHVTQCRAHPAELAFGWACT